jgi:hypothetical protein
MLQLWRERSLCYYLLQSTFMPSSCTFNKGNTQSWRMFYVSQSDHVMFQIWTCLVILPSDAPTSVSYRPQPKATRMWHGLQPIGSATIVDKRVTLLTFVPICDAAVMCQRQPPHLPTARSTLPRLLSINNSSKGPIQPNNVMQLRSAKWSSTPAIFKLLLLATKICRGCRQLQPPWRIQLSEDVSTPERRAIMLMCAPNCDRIPIRCHQPTHLPIEMPTLFLWLPGRTLLEEESTKGLLKKLTMPQWLVHTSQTRIPF